MADDNIYKKVLIDVQVADDDANAAFQALKSNIDALNNSTVLVSKATETYKNDVAALNVKLAKGKVEQQNIKTAIDKARLSQIEANNAQKQAKKDMVAASGSYDEAQKKLTALGRAIKSAEGGFKSQDAAIKAQIADYKKLNAELKAFDKEMGNHQRNVGGYEEALSGLNGILSRLIPGFSQFQGILQGAAKGFNAMGKSAGEAAEGTEAAEAGMEGMSVAGGVLIGVLAAITVGIAGAVKYLSQFANYSDKYQEATAGIGAQINQTIQNIINFDFKRFFGKIKDAGDQASEAQRKLQMMGRDAQNATTLTENENAQLGVMMKKFRDRATTATEATKIHGEALKILNSQYERNNTLAVEAYNAMIQKELAGKGFSQDQINSLRIERGEVNGLKTDYEKLTNLATSFVEEKQENGAQAGKDFLQSVNEGMQAIIGTNSQLQNQRQLFDNRNDAKQAKDEAYAEKEKTLQEEIARQTEAANSERIASLARMLEFQQESFAQELSKTDEYYRQLIFKQRDFIAKQEAIANDKKHSPKTRAAARNAISAAQSDIDQLNKEHYAAQEQLLTEHGKKMLAETQKAANSLKQAQIASISDENERQKQTNQLAYTERTEALNTEANQIAENEARLAAEIKTATGERLQILKGELAHQKQLYAINRDEATDSTLDYQQKEIERVKKFEEQKQAALDEVNVLRAKSKDPEGNSKALLDAQQQQLLHQYEADVSAKGLTDEKKLELEQKYLNDSDALNKAYAKKKKDTDLAYVQEGENAAFQIIQQSMERSFENEQIMMERQKTHDLQNQALTSTQRYAIEEQYRVKEGQAKVKQFKQEQEIALAKAAIDTAAAIIKAAPDVPLEILAAATGALQIGVIASEKAPAYATGGIHYESDGKGGVLPGYSRVDNMNARLRSGEGIVVSEAMRDPWARQVVSAINQTYGGRSFDSTTPVSWSVPHFASGGLYQPYTPTGDNGLRPQINISSNSRIHPDDINGIANAVANIKMPPLDIKDVNYQQGLLSQATDRLNY